MDRLKVALERLDVAIDHLDAAFEHREKPVCVAERDELARALRLPRRRRPRRAPWPIPSRGASGHGDRPAADRLED